MSIAPAAPPWPAHVITVASHPNEVARGRPAEFRQRGVLLDGTPSLASALVEISRHPESFVLVPSDLADMPCLDFIDVVCAFSERRVIVGVAPATEGGVVRAALDRGAAAAVGLPVTPARLVTALNDARPPSHVSSEVIEVGALRLDLAAHRVFWRGVEVKLAPKPFEMLHYIMAAHPRVLSIEELASEFGASEGGRDRGDRARVSIGRIRHLFAEADAEGLQPLETVHRVGYRLSDEGVRVASPR